MDLGSYGGTYAGDGQPLADAGGGTGAGDAGLTLSAPAAAKIEQLARERGADTPPLLRVYIEGGGCSGFQYGFELAEAPEADDLVFTRGAVQVVCDPLSYQYLAGAEIDYLEDLQGARFLVRNPNASTTCGCGSSFSV